MRRVRCGFKSDRVANFLEILRRCTVSTVLRADLVLGWVPSDNPRILAASSLLDPKASGDIYFVSPTEPGTYVYVCTVPGHSILMNGVMQVQSTAKLIEDLTWSIYRGKWNKLPDFSKLDPIETGKAKKGLIDLNVAKKQKGSFGVVFEGKLIVPKEEKYEFTPFLR